LKEEDGEEENPERVTRFGGGKLTSVNGNGDQKMIAVMTAVMMTVLLVTLPAALDAAD
jgi:membrane protein insertase Oxa1/YidC/SpoIIIJ